MCQTVLFWKYYTAEICTVMLRHLQNIFHMICMCCSSICTSFCFFLCVFLIKSQCVELLWLEPFHVEPPDVVLMPTFAFAFEDEPGEGTVPFFL